MLRSNDGLVKVAQPFGSLTQMGRRLPEAIAAEQAFGGCFSVPGRAGARVPGSSGAMKYSRVVFDPQTQINHCSRSSNAC